MKIIDTIEEPKRGQRAKIHPIDDYSEIKEIALNPAYVTSEDFKTLEIQGFPVRWMREDENSDKDIFTLLIDE